MSLRTQLLLAIASVTIATALVITWLGYSHSITAAEQTALRTAGAIAGSREQMIETLLLRQSTRAMAVLDRVQTSCGADFECWRPALEQYLRTEGARGGRVLSASGSVDYLAPHQDRISVPAAALATLVTYADGRRGYVLPARKDALELQIHYGVDGLLDIFARWEGLGEKGETFLTDRDGYFVTPARYASAAGNSHPISAGPMQACLAQQDGEVLDLDYRGVEVVHAFRNVEELGGACVMAHMDRDEAFAPARHLFREAMVVSASWSAGLLIVTFFVASFLSRPVVQLTQAARRLGAGDFRVDVDPRGMSRETRTLARTLREAAAALEQKTREQHELISILGHDLRNPLNAIVMSASVLEQGAVSDAQRRQVARIRSSGKRMARMVSDLLDFARIDTASGLPITRRPASLAALVREVVEELRSAHPDRLIVTELEGPGKAEVDADRCEQVVSNLVGNALQHSPKDSPVTVRLRCLGDQVLLSVHNHGAPIPPSMMSQLFKPFSRIEQKKGDGLGLGLYISDQIVRAHGGTLTVDSGEQGTTFTVTLPNPAQPPQAPGANEEAAPIH